MSDIHGKLYKNQKLKLFANNMYVYIIHLFHLMLNILPGIFRVAILRLFLKRCGSHVYVDHNVYIKFPWLVEIGDTVSINRGVEIYSDFFSGSKVSIGSGVRIAPNVKLHASGHELDTGEFLHSGGDILIKDNVWLGAGAIVLQGVEIGEGAVVAAGSVVTKSVPSKSVVAGVPARVVRQL